MNRVTFTLLAALLTTAGCLYADQEAAPSPWVKTSEDGAFIFKLVPEKAHWEGKLNERKVVDQEAFGVAYEIDSAGEFKEIWRIKGWHASEGYLSRDGRYFVRMGPWASDQENHTDLAIAFYDRGKLLEEYRVKELIKKPDLLEDSVSHYMWRPEIQTTPNGFLDFEDKTFHLVMVDKTSYIFEVATGRIQQSGLDPDAKSWREHWAEEQAASEKKGRELYESSTLRKTYDEHFTFSNIEAGSGKMFDVHFDGPEWRADLKPKRTYATNCEVEAVFPIANETSIDVLITPEEIDRAFQKVFAHPFVVQKLGTGAITGARMRITGDRLHWETGKLHEYLKEITGLVPKERDPLRTWVQIILDIGSNRGFHSIYLNTATGDLIHEDVRDHVLLDVAGRQRNSLRTK